MKDISDDEFRKRAKDLEREWHLAETRKLESELGLEMDVDTALVAFKYIPYILATIYYSWMNYRTWSKHKAEKEWEMFNLWADKSIDRVLSLAPGDKIDKENCRNDIKDLIKVMKAEVNQKNPTSASEILSNEIFKILQKYCPNVETREKELVDYIVKAELISLKG